jgi:hypothetical protein
LFRPHRHILSFWSGSNAIFIYIFPLHFPRWADLVHQEGTLILFWNQFHISSNSLPPVCVAVCSVAGAHLPALRRERVARGAGPIWLCFWLQMAHIGGRPRGREPDPQEGMLELPIILCGSFQVLLCSFKNGREKASVTSGGDTCIRIRFKKPWSQSGSNLACEQTSGCPFRRRMGNALCLALVPRVVDWIPNVYRPYPQWVHPGLPRSRSHGGFEPPKHPLGVVRLLWSTQAHVEFWSNLFSSFSHAPDPFRYLPSQIQHWKKPNTGQVRRWVLGGWLGFHVLVIMITHAADL